MNCYYMQLRNINSCLIYFLYFHEIELNFFYFYYYYYLRECKHEIL